MSDANEAKPKDAAAAPAAPKAKGGGKGAGTMIVGIIFSAIFSAAGAFGGVRVASKTPPPAAHVEAEAVKPPGPTVALEPFLITVQDASKKPHAMKLTVAIEFDAKTKEEEYKAFTPRIRDAILSHVRMLSFEEAVDQENSTKLREDLLERCKKVGAKTAERVLITDLVSQ